VIKVIGKHVGEDVVITGSVIQIIRSIVIKHAEWKARTPVNLAGDRPACCSDLRNFLLEMMRFNIGKIRKKTLANVVIRI
jgi:hypothetical protein